MILITYGILFVRDIMLKKIILFTLIIISQFTFSLDFKPLNKEEKFVIKIPNKDLPNKKLFIKLEKSDTRLETIIFDDYIDDYFIESSKIIYFVETKQVSADRFYKSVRLVWKLDGITGTLTKHSELAYDSLLFFDKGYVAELYEDLNYDEYIYIRNIFTNEILYKIGIETFYTDYFPGWFSIILKKGNNIENGFYAEVYFVNRKSLDFEASYYFSFDTMSIIE